MRTVLFRVDVVLRVCSLRPVGAQQDPRIRGNAPILLLPLADALWCHEIIWVVCRFRADVNDASRTNKFARRDAVYRIVREVLPRDPVNRRVEMSTRVFASLKPVPVPGGAPLIVM